MRNSAGLMMSFFLVMGLIKRKAIRNRNTNPINMLKRMSMKAMVLLYLSAESICVMFKINQLAL